ncbi:WW domain-binding protein 1-like [Chiloscyllium plagiosum]|uniref:WW domain-binding protein 1-like n=1 Tax=Chiloscyllium plagiosum TaxID=36176 RepID=UPI001CB802BD|nr:WW domain-binding protein 1-like [Chiloscyllium plagiosum]
MGRGWRSVPATFGRAHGRRCGGRLGRKFERNLNERRRRRLRNMAKMIVGFLLFISPAFPVGPSRMELQAEAKELCFGVNNEPYWCETGYCCGETECCTYYYELWWFWLVWTIIIMLSCCCAYRHRRVKLRLQQEQRQREISLMAYQGASTYTTQPLDLRFWTNCKLPDYEEVAGHPPTPPPPYTELQQQNAQTSNQENVVVESQPDLQESVNSLVAETATQEAESSSSTHEQEHDHQVSDDPTDASPTSPPDRENGDIVQDEESAALSTSDFKMLETDSDLCDQGEGKEESSRHRRITGDSGIEVCVCQLDEDPYHEEMGLMGSVGASQCCESQSSCSSHLHVEQLSKQAITMCPKLHTAKEREEDGDIV